MSTQAGSHTSAKASEISLPRSQWQQILEADSADQVAYDAEPLSEAEIREVQRRLSQLRSIDADTAEGQARLMSVIEDSEDLPYIRTAASTHLAQAKVRQLKQVDANSAQGRAHLLKILSDPDALSIIRQAVLEHLANAHVRSAEAQQVVLQLIRKDTEKHLCWYAIYALQDFGAPADDAARVLIAMVDDHRNCGLKGLSSGEISHAAVEVLGRYGPAAAEAIPRLEWEIDPANPRSSQREAARIALGRIAPRRFPFYAVGKEAIEPLVEQLSSDIAGRRLRAAERLLELHKYASPAAMTLETVLHDENRPARAAAAAALLAMKPHSAAGSVLLDFADSDDRADRSMLLNWLCSYTLNFDDTELLLHLLSDPDSDLRSRAAVELVRTERHVSEAFEAMVTLYRLGGHDQQIAALKAFGSFRPELLVSARTLLEGAAGQAGAVGYLAKRLLRSTEYTDDDAAK